MVSISMNIPHVHYGRDDAPQETKRKKNTTYNRHNLTLAGAANNRRTKFQITSSLTVDLILEGF